MAFSPVRSSWARISSFARLLRANAGVVRSLNDELVAAHGVTIEQYEILNRLALQGSQADLAEPPLVTAANIGRELTSLERDGLLRRTGAGDTFEIALTAAGREKVREARTPQLDALLCSGLADG